MFLVYHSPAATEAVRSALVAQPAPADSRLYESAHRALSGTDAPLVEPVLKALADPISSDSETPLAAHEALGEWRKRR